MATSPASTPRIRLYALGSNGNGQLGLGHEDDTDHAEQCCFRKKDGTIANDVPFDEDESISKIVAGGNHSLLLTSKGRLWTTGSTLEGQRGKHSDSEHPLGRTEEWQEFRLEDQTELPDQPSSDLVITDVAATFSASFLVINGQKVYSFGTGTKGELGLGADTITSAQPQLCFGLPAFEGEDRSSIISISACMSHVVVLSSTGTVFGWGASRKGQLGELLREEKMVWTPQRVEIVPQTEALPSQILTGRDFTFLVLQESDRKSPLLLGDAAKIGITLPLSRHEASTRSGNLESQSEPDEVNLASLRAIQTGWTTIAVLTESNTVHTFGNSRRSVVSAPLHNMRSIAAGSEHCIGLTEQGQVVAWGWGEHGNCGSNTDRNKNVRDGFNVLFESSERERVLGLAAGCATSFFWTTDYPV